MTNQRQAAEAIFRAGIASAQPDRLVREQAEFLQRELRAAARVFVVGAGKASAIMAREVEDLCGDRITAGHVVVKHGHGCALRRIALTEAGHPVPDANSFKGAAEVLAVARRAGEGDILLCLWSGGASALLADGPPGAQPDDMIRLNDALVRSGADIAEINCVRKHLSSIKGGQLARAGRPDRTLSLILSDVIGNPLDAIASGPTAPDMTTFAEAWRIVEKYRLDAVIPAALGQFLREGAEGKHADTPKADDPVFARTTNRIIGDNRKALHGCQEKAAELGFRAEIVTDVLQGDAEAAVTRILEAAREAPDKTCLLFGGETTVKVTGTGLGGRNQHLALAAALPLERWPGVTLLAGGTDGTDGPTDAAGAVVDAQTVGEARAKGIDAERMFREFNSHEFFAKTGGHIVTGPTRTNVMDIIVTLVGQVGVT